MIIFKGRGKYKAVIPKGEPHDRLDPTTELAFKMVFALGDKECMRVINERWNKRVNSIRRPN